jgi:VWFA-related protein
MRPLLLLLLALPALQTAGQVQQIQVRRDEVMVDVIVTDRNGKPVVDLTAADFEVFEDGVRQQVLSFSSEKSTGLTWRDAGQAPPEQGQSRPLKLRNAHLISMVFDAATTSRERMPLVRAAALDFLTTSLGPEDFVAVFGIGFGLQILQPFTQDQAALKKAVEVATSGDAKRFGLLAQEIRQQLETFGRGDLPDATKIFMAETRASVADSGSEATRAVGDNQQPTWMDLLADPSAILTFSSLRILRTFDRYEREYQGRQSISGLMAIIESERVFPGRKTLLYFSEGFAIAPAAAREFRSVISAANRASTAIYSVDAAGLRLDNPNAAASQEIDIIAAGRMRNSNPELVVGGQSSLGRVEEAGRMNTVNTLDELSSETGGYTLKNTNDLKTGLRRIREDLRAYYVLSYSPANASFDGRFRSISVKVNRPELHVRSRSGYYAFRTLDNSPLFGYEAQLMEPLQAATPPNDFEVWLAACHFPTAAANQRSVPFFVQFPLSAISLERDTKTKNNSASFSVLVLARDASGQVVFKRSRRFNVNGTDAQLPKMRQENLSFNQTVALSPGDYRLDAVVRDDKTGKAAVRRIALAVPSVSAERLHMSGLVLSKAATPLSLQEKNILPDDPFVVEGSARLLPAVPAVYRKSADKHIVLFFTAYAPSSAPPPDKVTVAFFQNGKLFAQAGAKLAPPDPRGRIPYLTTFGLEHFDAGKYEVRVTIGDTAAKVSESAAFEITP